MPRRGRGVTEQAFERALAPAREEGHLDNLDGALIAAGRASARLVDDATTDGNIWMREAAIRRHVETLRELRLTPGSRPDSHDDDPFLAALASIQAAEHARVEQYRADHPEPTD